MDGVWGWDGVRASSFGQYLWEEFLGVGLVLLAAGVSLLAVRRRAAAGWMAAWIVPYVGVTILFKIEGQHDCWFVAAWMPLHLAVGLGLRRIAGRLPPAGQAIAPAVAALAGLAWAFLANHALLDQRRYGLAADLGGLYLDSVDPDAVVLLQGDDSNALALYLQRIRGRRPDVLLVHSPFLFMSVGEGRDWYDDRLLARHSFLRRPSYARTWSRMPDAEVSPVAVAAFLNANAGCGRPLFTELAPPAALLREDYELIPAGVLWKWVPAGTEAPDPRHWNVPIEAEALAGRFGRERGQEVRVEGGRIEVRPENYERRLLRALLQARRARAEDELRRGRFADALPRYESILRLDAEAGRDPGIAFGRGIALHGAGRGEDAEEALLRALALGLPSASAAEALSILGEGRRKRGDGAGAQEYFRRALAVPGLPPAVRGRIEERARTP
jgi:tetratricopeptide (TPR) repeat protein